MHRFTEGQAVDLRFDDGNILPARIIKNIDATCMPLTDMWLVLVDGWQRPFGFSGRAIVPANRP